MNRFNVLYYYWYLVFKESEFFKEHVELKLRTQVTTLNMEKYVQDSAVFKNSIIFLLIKDST